MKYRRKRLLVKLHRHNEGICHFDKGFSHLCLIFLFGGCCIIAIVSVIIFLLFFLKPCSHDSQCQTKNPCSIDSCVDGWCTYEQKDNCCTTDKECGEARCYTSYCDKWQNVCRSRPKINGSSCFDSDACTVDDICVNGICEGKTLTCDIDNQCRTGECKGGIGCIFHNKPNGISCDDNNPCTTNDECYNGMCAVGTAKDCSHLNDYCTIGACDIHSGDCVKLSRNEGQLCDDGLLCTLNDKCTMGECTGELDTCFDNNPCTVDQCVEGVGCMVQHQDYGDTCITGCNEHADCPSEYNCFDGTCIKTQNIENQQIRMIGYEIEDCLNEEESRLLLHFVLDTQEFTVGNEKRYRIIKDVSDITASPLYSALGFGHSVFNLNYNDFGNNIARTSFTIGTQCQRFTEDNCAYIFNNREFRFASKMYDCTNINGQASGCLDPNHFIWSAIDLSISTCSKFPGHVNVNYPRGNAVILYKNKYYRDMYNHIVVSDDDTRGIVGIETTSSDNVLPIITDMKICQKDTDHYLHACVDGTNTTACFNTGCFNWDPLDSPLSMDIDIIKDSSVTALALSDTFEAAGCYLNSDYNAIDKCVLDKCDQYGMDDYFDFIFKTVSGGGRFIFDIKYRYSYCTARRLLSTHDGEYAMTIVETV